MDRKVSQQLNCVVDNMLGDLSRLASIANRPVTSVRPSSPYGHSPNCNCNQCTGIHPVYQPDYRRSAISQPKQKDSMSLFNSIPGLSGASFGKISNNKIAIGFDGQVVFRKPDGSYVKVQTDAEGNRVQVQVLDLKLDVEFYRVPAQEIVAGDLIELDGQFLYVEENSKGGIKFVNPLTGAKSSKLQQTNILGLHFYSKIVSFFDLAGGQQGGVGLNGLNPMMLLALQGKNGTGGSDLSELLILQSLAGAQGGQQGGINPMMLMMLGGNAENDTFKQMMMLQAFSGNQGANPFGNLFQAPVVAPAPVKKATKRVASKAPVKAVPKKVASKVASKAAPKKTASKRA